MVFVFVVILTSYPACSIKSIANSKSYTYGSIDSLYPTHESAIGEVPGADKPLRISLTIIALLTA